MDVERSTSLLPTPTHEFLYYSRFTSTSGLVEDSHKCLGEMVDSITHIFSLGEIVMCVCDDDSLLMWLLSSEKGPIRVISKYEGRLIPKGYVDGKFYFLSEDGRIFFSRINLDDSFCCDDCCEKVLIDFVEEKGEQFDRVRDIVCLAHGILRLSVDGTSVEWLSSVRSQSFILRPLPRGKITRLFSRGGKFVFSITDIGEVFCIPLTRSADEWKFLGCVSGRIVSFAAGHKACILVVNNPVPQEDEKSGQQTESMVFQWTLSRDNVWVRKEVKWLSVRHVVSLCATSSHFFALMLSGHVACWRYDTDTKEVTTEMDSLQNHSWDRSPALVKGLRSHIIFRMCATDDHLLFVGKKRRLQEEVRLKKPPGPVLERLVVYSSPSRLYVLGSDASGTYYRFLRIDRSDPEELSVGCDPTVYTRSEVHSIISSLGGVKEKDDDVGVKEECKGYGILGFIKFLKGYSMILITKRRKVGSIAGHRVYTIDDVDYVYLGSEAKWSSSEEKRYHDMLSHLDLTRGFFFSYTYDLTRSLQDNMTKDSPPQSMFVWNEFLLRENVLDVDWRLPVIHGYYGQTRLTVNGHSCDVVVVARRSRVFAGTRYLKRGASASGHVANEVETEQILCMISSLVDFGTRGSFSSMVQMRGSIPLYWSHSVDSKFVRPKADIIMGSFDPMHTVTKNHFNMLSNRFGSPVIVLNLLKKKERIRREAIVGNAFKAAVDFINSSLPDDKKIIYIAWDFRQSSKISRVSVLNSMSAISEQVVRKTGFFFCNGIMDSEVPFHPRKWGSFRQHGVVRTNCIDCIDRTNIAQFCYGRMVMGHQLFALGLLSDPAAVEEQPDFTNALLRLYDTMGDELAFQYGGSRTVSAGVHNRGASWDIVSNIKRFYRNTFTDSQRQTAINLFLGNYIPRQDQAQLWDLSSDLYLHDEIVEARSTVELPVDLSGGGLNSLEVGRDEYFLEYRPWKLSIFEKEYAFCPWEYIDEHVKDLKKSRARDSLVNMHGASMIKIADYLSSHSWALLNDENRKSSYDLYGICARMVTDEHQYTKYLSLRYFDTKKKNFVAHENEIWNTYTGAVQKTSCFENLEDMKISKSDIEKYEIYADGGKERPLLNDRDLRLSRMAYNDYVGGKDVRERRRGYGNIYDIASFLSQPRRHTKLFEQLKLAFRRDRRESLLSLEDFVAHLVEKMRDAVKGISICDRVWHVQYQANMSMQELIHTAMLANSCFVGEELVDWVVDCDECRCSNRLEAIQMLDTMHSLQIFRHISYRASFMDNTELYRFDADEEVFVLNQRSETVGSWNGNALMFSSHLLELLFACVKRNTDANGKVYYDRVERSIAFREFCDETALLTRVYLRTMSASERICFFVNIFNTLNLHTLVLVGGALQPSASLHESRVGYLIGSMRFTLHEIRNGIIRGNRLPYDQLFRCFRSDDDPRLPFVVDPIDMRACLLLSDPCRRYDVFAPIHNDEYQPGSITAAAEWFCREQVYLDLADNRVVLPQIFCDYRDDFGTTQDELCRSLLYLMGPQQRAELCIILAAGSVRLVLRGNDEHPTV